MKETEFFINMNRRSVLLIDIQGDRANLFLDQFGGYGAGQLGRQALAAAVAAGGGAEAL